MSRPRKYDDVMSAVLPVRCTPEQLKEWQQRAARSGLPLGEWARNALNLGDAIEVVTTTKVRRK